MADGGSYLLLKGISKAFPGVVALSNVTMSANRGEIVGLVGKNGAGKSTLMNVLGGIVKADSGDIFIDGRKVSIETPRDAERAGIAFIHQELNVFHSLTVAENVFIDKFTTKKSKLIDFADINQRTSELLAKFGLDVDPTVKVRDLTIGQKQVVEIARALAKDANIIIFDEATSSLSESERNELFKTVRGLKQQGICIIYISHFLDEIFEICDRVVVLRDGETVGEEQVNPIDRAWIERKMIGDAITVETPVGHRNRGKEVLRVKGLTRPGVFQNVSFTIHQGEIVGLAGLMGSGRTEVARAIFGLDPITRGEIWVNGKQVISMTPRKAMRLGLGFVTENRKEEGLLLDKSIRENISLPNLRAVARRLGLIDGTKESAQSQEMVQSLSIVAKSVEQNARSLSGGNQQKVVVAKWLLRKPDCYILDEPTRGIDVGAKEEIYRLMNRLAEQGAAILMISSEIPELLRMADRIYVMYKGSIVAEIPRGEATSELIIRYATGGGVDDSIA